MKKTMTLTHPILVFTLGIMIACTSALALELETDDASNRLKMARRAFYSSDKTHDYKLTEADGKAWEAYGELDTNDNKSVSFDEFLAGADLPYAKWDGEVKRNIVYKRVGDKILLLDIYAPLVRKYDKAPVFYYTHGGGWAGGMKEISGNVKSLFESLSREGFVCVSVMYRLVKMYNPNDSTLMRDCIVDCRDGLRFLKKNEKGLGIDLSRAVVFGSSAGGHIAQLLTWSGEDDFAGDPALAKYKVKLLAGVSWFGPCDFRDTKLFISDGVKDKYAPDHWARRITKPKGKFMYDGADEKTRHMIEEVSPVYWLTGESAPLLHMHGDKDKVISVTQAHHLEKMAKETGAPVDVFYVKGSGHGWYAKDIEPDRKTLNKMTVDYILNQITSTKQQKKSAPISERCIP